MTYQTSLAYGAPWTCSGTGSAFTSNSLSLFSPSTLLRFQNVGQITNYPAQCNLGIGGGMVSSCTDTMPSVTIDLGASTALTSVTIFNRADCCQSRFAQFQILLGNSPPPYAAWGLVSLGNASSWTNAPLSFNPACYVQNTTINIGNSAQFPCVAAGRYLTLQQTFSSNGGNDACGQTAMNLCALFAYGPSSSPVVFAPLVAASPPPLHNWALSGSTWSDSGTSPLPVTLFGGAAVLPGTGLSFQPTASQPSPYACIPSLVLGGTDVSVAVWVQYSSPSNG